jgi:hypothetical protein
MARGGGRITNPQFQEDLSHPAEWVKQQVGEK